MVLGGGSNHGRSTNVDLINSCFPSCSGCDSFHERVKVYNYQLKGLEVELLELILVGNQPQISQQSGMNGRVKSLYSTIEGFFKAGHLGNFSDGNSCGRNCLGGGASRNNLDTRGPEGLSQFQKSSFIRHGNQCALDWDFVEVAIVSCLVFAFHNLPLPIC